MIEEAYVSFETAKLLKEKGFNEPCLYYYFSDGKIGKRKGLKDRNSSSVNTFSMPTLQMAMQWLRKIYKIHIIAEPCSGEETEPNLTFNRWFWTIFTEKGEYKLIRQIDEFPTYEQAVEAAIQYSLKNLI